VIEARDRESLKLPLDEQKVLKKFMASFHRFLSNLHPVWTAVPTWPVRESLVLLFGEGAGFRLNTLERRQ
jgi:hypothetical protein